MAGAARGGGGETAGLSEISRDEERVSNPWGSAGKPPEMGAVELPFQPAPGLDPSEQQRHVAEGSITRMRCCNASYPTGSPPQTSQL